MPAVFLVYKELVAQYVHLGDFAFFPIAYLAKCLGKIKLRITFVVLHQKKTIITFRVQCTTDSQGEVSHV